MTDRPMLESRLRELYDARMHGPLDRLCGLFAPEVRFRMAGTAMANRLRWLPWGWTRCVRGWRCW